MIPAAGEEDGFTPDYWYRLEQIKNDTGKENRLWKLILRM